MPDATETIDLTKLPAEVLDLEVFRRLICDEADFPKVVAHLQADAEPDEGDEGDENYCVEVPHRVDEALHRGQRRDFKEALYELSVGLGEGFGWLADLKPEDLK